MCSYKLFNASCTRDNLDVEEFIEEYKNIYYWQNRIDYENKIETYLNDYNNVDTVKNINRLKTIMAWKMGTINKFGKKMIMVKDGCEEIRGKDIILKGQNTINITELHEKIKKIDFNDTTANIIKELVDEVAGIGPVYAIAILHFVDKKRWPIYDQFVDRATRAIINNLPPWSKLNRFKYIFDTQSVGRQVELYEKYCKRLKRIFKDDYYKRKVDQALWVYGHMFKVK